MTRIARIVAPGYPHHITQRGNRRQETFFCDGDYRQYINLMAEWCSRCNVDIWGNNSGDSVLNSLNQQDHILNITFCQTELKVIEWNKRNWLRLLRQHHKRHQPSIRHTTELRRRTARQRYEARQIRLPRLRSRYRPLDSEGFNIPS